MRCSIPVSSLTNRGSSCPFLYQTKTILHQHVQCRQNHHRSASGVITGHSQCPPDRSSDEEPVSFLKQKAAHVASNDSKLGSSVTPSEQAVFDSIWALFEKPSPSSSSSSSPSKSKGHATPTDHADTDVKNILNLFSPLSQRSSDGDDEGRVQSKSWDRMSLDDAKSGQNHGERLESKSTTGESHVSGHRMPAHAGSQLNRERAMAEIQDFLRETAGSLADQSLAPSISNSLDAVQVTARRMVEDVADHLTTALASTDPRPDIAMWRVVEEKIFPLIQLLRPSTSSLASPPPPPSPPRPPSPSSSSLSNDDAGDAASDASQRTTASRPTEGQYQHPLIPPTLPLIPLLTQIYPSLTLLTLRLYTIHHPTSPYALALLPTLKSLGPTSYVLGAHTHFYNALLTLHWTVYSDLRVMHDLLIEMDTNGVSFDAGTLGVIEAVGEDRRRDVDGTKREENDWTPRGKSWWERREQMRWWSRVGVEWRNLIERRLDGHGRGDRDERVPVSPVRNLGREARRHHQKERRQHAERPGPPQGTDRPEYVVTL